MLKKILGAGAAVALSLSAAEAADIETYMSHDWSGPYIGLQAGYGWGESGASIDAELLPTVVASQPIIIDPAREGSIDAEGVLGGLHAGYNLQWDNLVLGIEGDAELSDMDGDTDVFFDDVSSEPFAKQEKEYDWLASLRLRAGYAMDRALFYATAGLAIGGIDMSFRFLGGTFDESETETAFGVTLGGGFEYALNDNLTLRAEYRYTDLENTSFSGIGIDFDSAKYKFENDFHAVRGGLSWYF